jgi:hypothetical protein
MGCVSGLREERRWSKKCQREKDRERVYVGEEEKSMSTSKREFRE